jgi:hypothetical protein
MPLVDHTRLYILIECPGQAAYCHIRRLAASSLTGHATTYRVFKSVGTFKAIIFQIVALVFFCATDLCISIYFSVKE